MKRISPLAVCTRLALFDRLAVLASHRARKRRQGLIPPQIGGEGAMTSTFTTASRAARPASCEHGGEA